MVEERVKQIAQRIEHTYIVRWQIEHGQVIEIGPGLKLLIQSIAEEIALLMDTAERVATLPPAPGRSESGDVR